jgi:ketosteroid isomerase-like protein
MPAKVPEEVNQLFMKFMKEGNLEAVLDLYDPEIAFVNQDGEIKRGISGIRDQLAHFVDVRQVFEFQIRKVVLNGDIALVHNKYEMVTPNKNSGYAIEVMRRQPDGSWRFFIGDPFTVGKTFNAS